MCTVPCSKYIDDLSFSSHSNTNIDCALEHASLPDRAAARALRAFRDTGADPRHGACHIRYVCSSPLTRLATLSKTRSLRTRQ